jgi:hypothetical protein
MGTAYPGPGATLGAAMVSGWVAGARVADEAPEAANVGQRRGRLDGRRQTGRDRPGLRDELGRVQDGHLDVER